MLARRPALPAAVIPVLVVVAILGYVAGKSGSSGPSSERLHTAQSANVVIGYPPGWSTAKARLPIPHLRLVHATTIAPRGDARRAGLLLGALPPGELAPLPSEFISGLRRLPATEIVNLEEIQAYKYAKLSVAGFERALTLFVIPDPGSRPTALACYAPSPSSSYMRTCEQAVATVSVAGQPQAYQLTPEPSYAGRISTTIASLDELRASLKHELRPDVTPKAVKRLATKLADGFRVAASALDLLEPSFAAEAVQKALADAIGRARDGYTALAAAAGEQDPTAYASAQKKIAKAEADVDRTLESFVLLGYSSTVQASPARS
ncbi:MAG TPA: hypothetical protein VHW67_05580 [Solirubrobacteraceae bacterium]|jgi:hypothetical protein|nr:hypothetical protein [Solirubrobacteraceae bacterium]